MTIVINMAIAQLPESDDVECKHRAPYRRFRGHWRRLRRPLGALRP
ncbi:MAG: hypothetical protein ACREFP_06765 [Acetobacteraceae bacterium]